MKKMKIMHILHSLQVGGLENGVVNLINNMNADSYEHAVCCIDSSGPMEERMTRPVPVFTLGKGSGQDYLLPMKLVKVLKKVNPDIVHTRNWGTIDGVIAARLAGITRVVHGEHGREATDPAGTNRRRNLARKLLKPLVSRYVTVSDDLRRWLIKDIGVHGDKVLQIINGVDTDRFCPPRDKTFAKQRIGLKSDTFVIGTVGRLDPVKDQQTLLRAFASLTVCETVQPGKNDSTVLLIVGSGPQEEYLKQLARELDVKDKVCFLGERQDIPQLMQAMDVFVLASVAEGISNTILEAMACGLPVVGTGVGGNIELVENGSTGFLFSAGDSSTLEQILSSYQTSPATLGEQGHKARVKAEISFSLSAMVEKYERLYLSLF